jgi:hypothetical protein
MIYERVGIMIELKNIYNTYTLENEKIYELKAINFKVKNFMRYKLIYYFPY